jgi:hypothetical protein
MKGVYLLHFETRLHHAGHYLGYSSCLKLRLNAHFAGNSAKLIHAVSLKGIRFSVVRLWIGGDRTLERKLHLQKNSPKLCPVCQKRVAPGYSIDVKRTVFDKAPPHLGSHTGRRKPMKTV